MPEAVQQDIGGISQEDIDRLLAGDPAGGSAQTPDAAQPPAEDPPGDPAADGAGIQPDPKPPDEPDSKDIDRLLNNDGVSEGPAPEGEPDRVILEDVPEEPLPRAEKRVRRVWAPTKGFWLLAAGVGACGMIANGFFWYQSHAERFAPKPEVRAFPIAEDRRTATAPVKSFQTSARSILLKGFLVPAPVERKDLTYITADVSIELTTPQTAGLIQAHAPYYRSMIYDVIRNALESMDKSRINEIGLKLEILKALSGSVPERSVRDVFVDAFVMF